MKALTIWQPWASLIVIGAKPFEWRRWRCPSSLIGQRVVIHAGARKVREQEVYDLIYSCKLEERQRAAGKPVTDPTAMDTALALELLNRVWSGTTKLPLAAGLAVATLGEPRLAADHGFPVDSDRLDEQNWGWPLTDIEAFAEPIPARGMQGIWQWPQAQDAIQDLLL